MTSLSALLVRSRELHRRHVTDRATYRALERAMAFAPTRESAHELTTLATHD
jgi:hypothetical protein